MIYPYYFTDENLKLVFKCNLDSHNIKQDISILSFRPIYKDFGIETRYNNIILKEMATIYATLFNQYTFKHHIIFSAMFYKINEEYQRSNEIALFNTLNNNQKVTESDINNIDVKSQLEHQIQIQETS